MNPGLVGIMNTDMDLFELILFSTIILLIFVCFMLTALFFTSDNLFLILLCLAFGLISVRFAPLFGEWWTMLKYQEKEKLNISHEEYERSPHWLFLDFSLKGNKMLFRIISLITAVFAVYDLIRYVMD
jgi:hypothetical protein